MNAALLVIGIALTLVPAALSRRGIFVRAGFIVALARATVPLGMLLVLLAMSATAAPAALEILSLSGMAALCERLIAHTVFGGRIGAFVGGVLTIGLATLAARGLWQARRDQANAYVDPAVGSHVEVGCCTLVVLPTDDHVAFAAPGSPPQLVVSRGTLTRLKPIERRVVIEHEKAHILCKHFVDQRLITAAWAALQWIPGIRSGLSLWQEALEWQADDVAANAVGSREDVARTIRAWAGKSTGIVLAFTGVEKVGRRLAYISEPFHRSLGTQLAGWTTVSGLWTASAMLIAQWVMHTHAIALAPHYCPI